MRTILHITRMNFLSTKAHVYTTTKTCEALAKQAGIEVILLSSDNSLQSREAKESFFARHEIDKRFAIVSLSSFGNRLKKSSWKPVNWLETIAVNLSIARYVLTHRDKYDILYFRDSSIFVPILISKYVLHKPMYMELHAVLHKKYKQQLNDFCAKISDGLVAISYGLKEYYERFNKNIIVSFCAAPEPERFARITHTKPELRAKLGLPQDKTILLYSGNMGMTGNYDSYGIEDIVNALPLLDDSIIFVGVGKKGNECEAHEELATILGVRERVMFLPWTEMQVVAEYCRAADILVLPASGAQIGNSPTKMFNNLVSGRLMVAARTQAIEEVLKDGRNALLVSDYKNPQEWAKVINRSLGDAELSQRIIAGALEDSKMYSWEKRGEAITRFIVHSTSS